MPKTTLSPISSSARQHLVDSDDVEGMEPHADVELIFTAILDEVLVTADTSGFQRLRTELFVFIGDEVHTQREIVHSRLLPAEIEDTDLGVWHTAAETRFWVWFVLTITITGTRT